jgi:hypothetical protein
MAKPLAKVSGYSRTAFRLWIENVVVAAVSILLGSFFFPLNSATWLPLVVLAAIAVYLVLRRRHRIALGRSTWSLSLALAVVVCVAIGLGLFSPILGSGSVVYIVSAPGVNNPFQATLQRLNVKSSSTDASLVVLTEPVRPAVLNWLDSNGQLSLRTIKVMQVSDEYYLVLPLKTALLKHDATLSRAERRVSQRINFFAFAPSTGVALGTTGTFSLNTGWAAGSGTTLSSTETLASTDAPWYAVNCGRSIETTDFLYVALLDYALTEASTGRMENAFATLARAAENAPSTIERLRIRCLLAHWSLHHLPGSLGGLQSVGYYFAAIEELIAHFSNGIRTQTAHNRRIIEWAQRKLHSRVSHTESLFQATTARPEWSALTAHFPGKSWKLGRTPIPDEHATLENPKAGKFDRYASQLALMGTRQLAAEAQRASANPEEARIFVELGLVEVMRRTLVEPERESAMLLDSVSTAIQACGNDWKDAYAKLIAVHRLVLSGKGTDPTKQGFMLLEANGFPQVAEIQRLGERESATARFPLLVPPPPKSPWWSSSYIDWFSSVVAAIGAGTEGAHTKLLFEARSLATDGEGTVFLPGVALAYMIARQKGPPELADEMRLELRRNLGMDLEQYVARLQMQSDGNSLP